MTNNVPMRYVIMANGRGSRWRNYLGKSKHLIEVDGETLLARTTRLVLEADLDAEVLISSSSPLNTAPGAVRHCPERYEHEFDRFCYELIAPSTCFLYGDTFYTESTIQSIIACERGPLTFFGNERSIVAVKSTDEDYLRSLVDSILSDIESGRIADAKGWDLYHRAAHDAALEDRRDPFVHIEDATQDFNAPEDYEEFLLKCD